MLEYKRIDILQGIDFNKTNLSKEYDICHYWYFKDIGSKYQPYLCNECHDLMQKRWVLVILLLYILSSYRIHFLYMSEDDAINIMNSSNLVHKRVVL